MLAHSSAPLVVRHLGFSACEWASAVGLSPAHGRRVPILSFYLFFNHHAELEQGHTF